MLSNFEEYNGTVGDKAISIISSISISDYCGRWKSLLREFKIMDKRLGEGGSGCTTI
jgi:hypothetical protein